MKNKFYLLPILVLMLSCSKKDSPQPEAATPVSGTIYTSTFTAQTAIVKSTNFNLPNYKSDELFAIYLSANSADDCAADVKKFPVRLIAPKKVGKFTENDIYVLIQDPNSVNGALFSSNSTIEITSVTADKVTGKVDAKFEGNSIKGSFEAKICQ